MVQAETKYRLFRKFFHRKLKTKSGIELPEPVDNCSEDEIERVKVRKLQLALKAERNMLIQLMGLEENPKSRYDHIVTHVIFGLLFTSTVLALLNLLHTLFFFESYPSDPLDVFRSVACDNDGCTVRSYFDLEPQSIVRILFWLLFGSLSSILCIRSFFGIDTRRMMMHTFSAVLFSTTWVVKRETHYALARVPL